MFLDTVSVSLAVEQAVRFASYHKRELNLLIHNYLQALWSDTIKGYILFIECRVPVSPFLWGVSIQDHK